jgi:hypothetical protein
LPGSLAEFLVGGQSNHGVGIVEAADQGRHDLGICLSRSQAHGPGSGQRRLVLDLAKISRAVATAPDLGQ